MSEGEFKKRILSMDIGEEDAVRVATILEVLVEAKKEIGREVYGFATLHDIPRLQKVFEKWFGVDEK